MNTITVTVPLTAENIKIISQLTTEPPVSGWTKTVREELNKIQESDNTTAKESKEPEPSTTEKPVETNSAESVSKTDVRAIALKLSKAGKQAELKEIFNEFGAEKLSEVKESDYPALKARLEETAVALNG